MKELKKAFVIQHIHFEDLGNLSAALALAGFTIQYFSAMNKDHLEYIEMTACDLLIILGGPIGVYDHVHYPYLDKEKQLIEQQLKQSKGLIGICLGCQLISSVLGGRVYAGQKKEIGWGAIQINKESGETFYRDLNDQYVLHWHGDTFELPAGSIRIASSDHYINQGFVYADNVLALQFHIEVQPHRIEEWLVGHACELNGLAEQQVQKIRDETYLYAPGLQLKAHTMWSNWLTRFDEIG